MKRRGFTLTEVIVAIAVLAVVTTIALPNLLKVNMTANEAAVIEGMRAVAQACESYRMNQTQFGRREYPLALDRISSPRMNLPYLDARFAGLGAGAVWRGYRWTYTVGPPTAVTVGNVVYQVRDQYILRADPVRRGVDGQRSFFLDQTTVIRFNPRAPAGPADPPVEPAR